MIIWVVELEGEWSGTTFFELAAIFKTKAEALAYRNKRRGKTDYHVRKVKVGGECFYDEEDLIV